MCLTCYTGGCAGPDGHSQRHHVVTSKEYVSLSLSREWMCVFLIHLLPLLPRTEHPIVVNIRKREVPKPEPEGEEPPAKVRVRTHIVCCPC